MNLRAFHAVFISASVLLALGLGAWCLPTNPLGATLAVVCALGLVVYEAWFLRKTRKLT
jgi:Flp pilus assembly protein TadB